MLSEGFFEIIGLLPQNVADMIGRKSSLIVIDKQGIEHIKQRHSNELNALGISALDFSRFVAQNYNEIRKGSKNELFIVVNNSELTNTAIIRLKEKSKGEYYYVETACPMRKGYVQKKDLIWKRSAP